jgi:4-hydroxythreonine-4-phosphate dehydrogenase
MQRGANQERSRDPVVGITIGNAAGIGPEIVLKSLAAMSGEKFTPVVIGDFGFLTEQNKKFSTALKLERVDTVRELASGAVSVVDLDNLGGQVEIGIESAVSGRASGEYIEKAVAMWSAGQLDAIATAPISKRSLAMGGYDFPGHTEFLAALTNTDRFAMSFFADELRVVLMSTHVSLARAIELVTAERLIDLIEFTDLTLSKLLGRKVRIAVAGLNPHASENGMFGREEADVMEPAIAESVRRGIDVTGPYAADTIFLRGFKGEFDAVVACYHDQATIAVKSISFGSAVNVTLGLPLIRTSVDHGTAFDIAGKGIADESSMIAAIRLAAKLALGNDVAIPAASDR